MTASQVQAVAFRDTFIQPLVDQLARQEEKLTAQAEQIGRLSAERDQLRADAADAARGPQEPQDAPIGGRVARDTAHPSEITLGLRVRRWLRRMTGEAHR